MNERIRQLAEEATSIVEMVSSYGYMSSYANFDREKFAELIVRECILGIKMTMVRDGYDTKHYLQSIKHIDYIRKQFGVEE